MKYIDIFLEINRHIINANTYIQGFDSITFLYLIMICVSISVDS